MISEGDHNIGIAPDSCGMEITKVSRLGSALLRRANLIEEYPWMTRNSFRYLKKLSDPPPFFRLGREDVIFEDDWVAWLRRQAG